MSIAKDSGNLLIKVGDMVSRTGFDSHKILEINEGGDLMLCECISDPSGCFEAGDQEWNLPRHYSKINDFS